MLAYEGGFSGTFKVLLVLHILSAIVGLGGVMLNGLYAAQSRKRPGPAGRAISEANYAVSMVAEKAIYLIAVFGVLLLATSQGAFKFGTKFVWMSLVLYFVAIGISHSIMSPGHKKINALLLEMEQGPPAAGGPPPQVLEVQAIGKRLAAGGATLDVVLALILILMVWQPR
jgi:Predicted integral membrane protein (DUF2269)